MIIRVTTNTANLRMNTQALRVIRVYNRNVPAGMTEALFTAAGQLLGSTGEATPGPITAPTTDGQLLVARLSEPYKARWEDVDLSQLVQTAEKTAAYTASVNDHVLVNLSAVSADVPISLPSGPSANAKVRVSIVAGNATYKAYIERNGSLVMGGTDISDYNMRQAGESYYFEYTGSTLGWMVVQEKRHVTASASAASHTPTGGSLRNRLNITAQAQAVTINAPSGYPEDGNQLIIRIKDNGTARAITWNAIYRSIGATLPTTTVISKTHYIGLMHNSTDNKWDCVATVTEA